jgi:hypothetical protein
MPDILLLEGWMLGFQAFSEKQWQLHLTETETGTEGMAMMENLQVIIFNSI